MVLLPVVMTRDCGEVHIDGAAPKALPFMPWQRQR
jgi:hypothetical protein